MIRTKPNYKITKNFSFYEMMESSLPYEAVKLNWLNIDDYNPDNAVKIIEVAQSRRDLVNRQYKSDTSDKEIGFILTSAFRCLDWERIRKRSGASQHVKSLAVDIQPINCSDEMATDILQWLHNQDYSNYEGGLALKKPTYKNRAIHRIGFLHYDARGFKARWSY